MEAPIPTKNIKTIEIDYEGEKYLCRFNNIEEESLYISVFLLNSLKYKGKISLDNIKAQILTFSSYSINEIIEEIFLLNNGSISIIKKNGQYKLKIKFIILRKEQNLTIDLIENDNDNE